MAQTSALNAIVGDLVTSLTGISSKVRPFLCFGKHANFLEQCS